MDMLDDKALEDKAWQNMSEILDDKMPENKLAFWWKRYFIVFFILLFAGIGMSSYMYILSDDSDDIQAVMQSIGTNNIHIAELVEQDVEVDEHVDNAEQEFVAIAIHNEQTSSSKPVNDQFITSSFTQDVRNQTTTNQSTLYKSETYEKDSDKFKTLNAEVPRKNSSSVEITTKHSANITVNVSEIKNSIVLDNFQLENTKLQAKIPLLTSIIAPRRVEHLAFSQINFYPEVTASSWEVGLKTIIGAKGAPWSFGTGISYENINFGNNNVYNRVEAFAEKDDEMLDSNVTPSIFEERSIQNSDLITRLHQVNIPITFHYRVKRCNIGIGLNNTINVAVLASNTETNIFENTVNLYRAGIVQQFDFDISRRFNIGLTGTWDITGLMPEDSSNKFKNMHRFAMNFSYKF